MREVAVHPLKPETFRVKIARLQFKILQVFVSFLPAEKSIRTEKTLTWAELKTEIIVLLCTDRPQIFLLFVKANERIGLQTNSRYISALPQRIQLKI